MARQGAPERSRWLKRAPRARDKTNVQVVGIYAALAVAWTVLSFISPHFLTLTNIRSVLVTSSTVSLIAAGLTVVMIAGEIDLSFAAMQAFAGSVAGISIITFGLPWPVGVAIALLAGTFAGVVSGTVAIVGKLDTFITTLAMLGIVQGSAFLMTGGQPVFAFPEAFRFVGTARIGVIPVALILVALIYLVLYLVLNKTVFGLQIFAVGGSRTAAARVGISRAKVVIIVLGLSGFLSSIAGIMIASRLDAASGQYGASDLLPAIAGVIIGGTSLQGGVGSLGGTFGGVLIVETINDGLTLMNVSQFWQQVVVGVIIMAAVVIDQKTRERLTGSRLRRFQESDA